MVSGFWDALMGNSVTAEAAKEEKELREAFPSLLQTDERIVFAFVKRGQWNSYKSFLTDRRILVRDVKGLTGKSIKYKSISYHLCRAWAISTAGGGMDSDSELAIWPKGMGKFEIEFSKDKVDLFAIQRLLASKMLPAEKICRVTIPEGVLPGEHFEVTVEGHVVQTMCPYHLKAGKMMSVKVPSLDPNAFESNTTNPKDLGRVEALLNFVGDDGVEVDPREVQKQLTSLGNAILTKEEKVEKAFKGGRDYTVFTSKRLLVIDKRGVTGKKTVYLSVLWSCVRAFSVETAGGWFDRDSEIKIYTSIEDHSLRCIEQDLRSNRVDPMPIQRFLCDMLLGIDNDPPVENIESLKGQKDQGQSWLAWFGDDVRQIDATEADAKFRSEIPLLQGSERCQMAFKGRRDLILFTTKRFLSVDFKGWSGKKQEYLSIPWSSVQCFAVESAGNFDKDDELKIWTDVNHGPPPDTATWAGLANATGDGDDGEARPASALVGAGLAVVNKTANAVIHATDLDGGKVQRRLNTVTRIATMLVGCYDDTCEPSLSHIKIDFEKGKVDLMAVHRFLSARCLPTSELPAYVPVPGHVITDKVPTGAMETMLNWLGDDHVQLDAKEVEMQLQEASMLIEGEIVAMAYVSGRDRSIFTNRRILMVDVQGWTGKKVQYTSIPYSSIRAFSVETAGSWDRDTELFLCLKNHWDMKAIELDFRSNQTDVLAIENYLASQVFGAYKSRQHKNNIPPKSLPTYESDVTGFLDFFGDNYHQIDTKEVDRKLRVETPILQEDEVIEAAYKCGRDTFIHTSKRLLIIDVQGLSGKKVSYSSIPLMYCTGFNIKTAGLLDRDAEMKVYTDGFGELELDFSKGQADVREFWDLLQTKLLIPPPPPPCVECKGIGCTFCEREDGDEDDEEGQETLTIIKKAPARAVRSAPPPPRAGVEPAAADDSVSLVRQRKPSSKLAAAPPTNATAKPAPASTRASELVLPTGWKKYEGADGSVYYHNLDLNLTKWRHPLLAPAHLKRKGLKGSKVQNDENGDKPFAPKWVLIALAVVLLLLIKVFITPEAGVLESNGEAAATAPASRASLKKMLSGVTTAPRKGVKAVLGGVGRVFGAARKKNNVPIEGEK